MSEHLITPAEDLHEWIVDNFTDLAIDDATVIARQFAKENGWDIVDVDFMVEEIVEKLQEGILNVVEMYEGKEVVEIYGDNKTVELSTVPNYIYFTFGSRDQIYEGGWIKIRADNLPEAQKKFIKHYGDKAWKHEGILNYCSDYSQQQYEEEEMFREGNFGKFCHEEVK